MTHSGSTPHPDLFGEAIAKSATISDCGKYRYQLKRVWSPASWEMPIIMLNPSTADASFDDPTIRRCMTFARREKFGGIVVVNLFAWRATEPDELSTVSDPVGPNNKDYIQQLAHRANYALIPVLCAWGSHSAASAGENMAATVLEIVRAAGAHTVCLGKTNNGSPRHPLYVDGDQPFEVYP